MTSVPPPVLILASRESGGSLLAALFDRHPQFCGASHLNLLAFEELRQLLHYAIPPRESHLHGLQRLLSRLLTGEETVQAAQAVHRWLDRRARLPVAEVHAELRALVAPRRLVDYSPLAAQNGAAMARALAAVPDAAVIHLTRDPFAFGRAMSLPVWQSVMTSLDYWDRRGRFQPSMDIFEIGEQFIDWSVTPPVFDPQFAWYRTQNAACSLLQGLPPGRVLHLDAAALAADPDSTVARLLDWLGAAADPGLLAAMLDTPLGDLAATGSYLSPFGTDFEMIATPDDANPTARGILSRWHAQRHAAPPDAQSALPWRGDGMTLLPEVAALARRLGYDLA